MISSSKLILILLIFLSYRFYTKLNKFLAYNFVVNLYDKKNEKININLDDEIIKTTLIK